MMVYGMTVYVMCARPTADTDLEAVSRPRGRPCFCHVLEGEPSRPRGRYATAEPTYSNVPASASRTASRPMGTV
ncbi:hypothetical protein [Rubrivirga sp.]|uniref:hypothetical protein n=1 Tax=Rubrivirga sp. TaxID=1885344 RepID=UPI003C72BDBA